MVDDDEPELTPAELAALSALPREVQPPPWLEDRVVAALPRSRPRYRQAFQASPRWRTWGWRVAAFGVAVMLFIGGFLAGGRQPHVVTADAEHQLYFLLLREGVDFRPPPNASQADLINETAAWANGLWRQGHLVLGRRLADRSWLLSADRPPARLPILAGRVSGLFLLRTASEAQAIALARTCPFLRWGGQIELRRDASVDQPRTDRPPSTPADRHKP